MEAKIPISLPLFPVGEMLDNQPSSPSAASFTTPSQQSSRRNSERPESTTLPCPESSTIAETLENLKMSEEEPKQIFLLLGSIFCEVEKEAGVVLVDELRIFFDAAHDNDRIGNKDVQVLRLARGALDKLWESGSNYLTVAAKVLADTSRDPAWRIPLGQAGVLDFFLEVVGVGQEWAPLLEHALRLIGNSCADTGIPTLSLPTVLYSADLKGTDRNRQRVVKQNSLRPIINLIYEDDPDVSIWIPVLYNICVDYESAEKQAAEAGCLPALMEVLPDRLDRSSTLLNYTCRLLESVVALSPGLEFSPENAVKVLFATATKPLTDLDDCSFLVSLAVTHLREERFQNSFLRSQALDLPLTILSRCYSSDFPIGNPAISSNPSHSIYTAAEEELVSAIGSQLVHTLSDLSASPDFGANYPLESPVVGSLRAWLSTTHSQLQMCACIMLGNLSRSHEASRTMVHQCRIHETLITLLQGSDDTAVLHSAAAFLKNLALLSENKAVLGEAGVMHALPRLWAMEITPHLQHDGASLTRQLVSNSFANVQRLLTSLSPDPDSPAHERTYLSLLVALSAKSDDSPTKIEIARTITAICRTLNSTQPGIPSEQVKQTTHRLYALHPDLARPLAVMVSQSRWPVVRSEGWFAFALMARSREGSIAVSDVVHAVEVYQPLVETVTGKLLVEARGEATLTGNTMDVGAVGGEDGPPTSGEETAQEHKMRPRDRDNTLILVSELLKNMGEDLGEIRRGVLEDLLQGHAVPTSYDELVART